MKSRNLSPSKLNVATVKKIAVPGARITHGAIYLARTAPLQGVLTAIFATYTIFGMVNSLMALMNRDKF